MIFLQLSQGGNYNPWFTWVEDSPKQQFHVLPQQPEPYCNSYLSPRWLIQRPSWREIQDYLEYQMAKERRSIMKKHTRLWSKFIWTISQPESRVDLCLKKHCSMFSRIAKCLRANTWIDRPYVGMSYNLGDRLSEHLLKSRARAATLLKSMRRYLGVNIRQLSSGSDSLLVFTCTVSALGWDWGFPCCAGMVIWTGTSLIVYTFFLGCACSEPS